MYKKIRFVHLGVLALCLIVSWYAGRTASQTILIEKVTLQHQTDEKTGDFYLYKDKPVLLAQAKSLAESFFADESKVTDGLEEFVYVLKEDGKRQYMQYKTSRHFGWWSLLPAICAVLMCFLTREAILSLTTGAVCGALMLQQYNLPGFVVSSLGNENSAKILILYLWLLGGLLGVWAKTGATQAFADYMAKKFVKGPRSAKVVAWCLGIVFFQGGTVSTVLVGTSVKPLADQNKVSHEELAYIVDSTASPIASQIALNAWPGYVQAFIFVPGVAFLATEELRIAFFFRSVPFCFYAIFAVLFTFLLAIEKPLFVGKKMRAAIKRSRETGELDHPDAQPLAMAETKVEDSSSNDYKAGVYEFFLPLLLLITIAVGTFVASGSPDVLWAFAGALILSCLFAVAKGMSLTEVVKGGVGGMKTLVGGALILLMATVVGAVSKDAGAGQFLVGILGNNLQPWMLPGILFMLCLLMAFSTGTSWGTYAVVFPLAMPLAWAVAGNAGMSPESTLLFMTVCFATVMDGSVFGDQCSPVSDTTVLSSMCTGCDLMDHVKTQLPQASIAGLLALVCWTLTVVFFC